MDTVPVTERALIQRINRKLRPDDKTLKTARERAVCYLGHFYTVGLRQNRVLQRCVDLEAFCRKLQVLAGYEHLER